jgi:hypothetical protein
VPQPQFSANTYTTTFSRRLIILYWIYLVNSRKLPLHKQNCPKFKVTLWLTVRQSVSISWCRAPFGTCDHILLPVGMLLSEICGLVSVGHPLWREDRSAVCSAITRWSESRRTRNHTLLSRLRLPQPEGPGSHIYIPRNRVWPSYTPEGYGPINLHKNTIHCCCVAWSCTKCMKLSSMINANVLLPCHMLFSFFAIQSVYLYLNRFSDILHSYFYARVYDSPLCIRLMWTLSFWGWQNFLPQKSHKGRVRCGFDAQPYVRCISR